jgi:hypothetical protein
MTGHWEKSAGRQIAADFYFVEVNRYCALTCEFSSVLYTSMSFDIIIKCGVNFAIHWKGLIFICVMQYSY